MMVKGQRGEETGWKRRHQEEFFPCRYSVLMMSFFSSVVLAAEAEKV